MVDGANEATEVIRFPWNFEFNILMARITLFEWFENKKFQVQFWHPETEMPLCA